MIAMAATIVGVVFVMEEEERGREVLLVCSVFVGEVVIVMVDGRCATACVAKLQESC